MQSIPNETAGNGRTTGGQFAMGNRAAVGHGSHGQRLRSAILSAITGDDVSAIVRKLIEGAKGGDVRSAKLVLDFIGKPKGGEPVVLSATTTAPMTAEDLAEAKRALGAKVRRLMAAGIIPVEPELNSACVERAMP